MDGVVVPLSYFDTSHVCKWRFILSGAVESEMSVEEVVSKAISENKKFVIGEIVPGLYFLAKERSTLSMEKHFSIKASKKGGEKRCVFDAEFNGYRIYEEENYRGTSLKELYMDGIASAIYAMVLGAVEDALRGEGNYSDEYREYLKGWVGEDCVFNVEGYHYPLFQSAMLLLLIALMVRRPISMPKKRGRMFNNPLVDFEALEIDLCTDCPFIEQCSVAKGIAMPKNWASSLREALLNAILLDSHTHEGWYALYRAAMRIFRYSRARNPKIPIMMELKKMSDSEMQYITVSDKERKKLIEKSVKNKELSEDAIELFESILDEMVGSSSTVINEDAIGSENLAELLNAKLVQIDGIRKTEIWEDDTSDLRVPYYNFSVQPSKEWIRRLIEGSGGD